MAELDSVIGAVLIAGLLAAVIYGLTILQTFIYTQMYGSDSIFMKCLVSMLLVLDTVHMAFISHALYFYLVTNFGIVKALATPTWSLIIAIYLTGCTGIIVRIFFAKRLYILCGAYRPKLRIALPVLVMIPTLTTFITAWIFASNAFIVRSFARLDSVSVYLYVSFGTSAFADTLIAGSMCTLLYKSRTGIKRTDSLLTTLIILTVNTGLLTSLFALSCLITYSIWPNLFIYVGMYFSLNKLYVNSLLGSLNARRLLRSKDVGSAYARPQRSTRIEFAAPVSLAAGATSASEPSHGDIRLTAASDMDQKEDFVRGGASGLY